MKKLLSIILIVLTALSLAACSDKGTGAEASESAEQGFSAASQYPGTWFDYVSKRATMEIKPAGDHCTVKISWGNSAFESVEWLMNAVYNAENGMLEYSDGVKQIITYENDVEDPKTDTLYTDGKGALRLSGGMIMWTDENDPEAADGRVFLRDEADAPAELKYIGYYESEGDGSTLQTTLGFDGKWLVDISITRLCQLNGTAVYNAAKDALDVTVTDPSGNPMALTITEEEGYRKVVTVTDSSWSLLPSGGVFTFE